MTREPWDYLEPVPAADAPVRDCPAGLYCPDCRSADYWHCASPEWCGGMRRQREGDPFLPRVAVEAGTRRDQDG
jgi:hypothetical protein